jgi:hypothetical protein
MRFLFHALLAFAAFVPFSAHAEFYKGNDLLFSKRFDNQAPPYAQFVNELGANRLVWHYTGFGMCSRSTLDDTSPQSVGSSPILDRFSQDPAPQCALPLYVYKTESATPVLDMQCRDLAGEFVPVPLEKERATKARGDIFKPAYFETQKLLVERMVSAGCAMLQQDGPTLNAGALEQGGCFSTEGDEAFRDYLKAEYKAELNALGVANLADFSYSAHLKHQAQEEMKADPNLTLQTYPSKLLKRGDRLMQLYRDFSAVKGAEFLNRVKSAASKKARKSIPLSVNISVPEKDTELYQAADFVMTEVGPTQETPYGLTGLAAVSQRTGKPIVISPSTGDTNLIRAMFASTYALGHHMILPFDIAVPGQSNYTAKGSDLVDLTEYVRANPNLLNRLTGLETYGHFNGSSVTNAEQLSDKVKITHSAQAQQSRVARGAKVRIGRRSYVTVAESDNGTLFFSPADWSTLSDSAKNKQVVERIVNPDGSGQVFQIPFFAGQIPVLKIHHISSKESRIHFLHSDDYPVEKGDRLRIGENDFTAISSMDFTSDQAKEWGPSIDINAVKDSLPQLGDPLLWVSNQFGRTGFNALIPSDNAPRVRKVEREWSKPGTTTVLLTGADTLIATGTEYTFAQTGYTAKTIASSTGGLLYFNGDLTKHIFPGQAVIQIQRPNQIAIEYVRKSPAAPKLWTTSSVSNVLLSVRTGKYSAKTIHVVNWNSEPVSLAVAFKAEALLGILPTVCTMRQAGDANSTTLPIADAGEGVYRVEIHSLKTWGTFRCR